MEGEERVAGPQAAITCLNYMSLVLIAHWPELVPWLFPNARLGETIILKGWEKIEYG